MTAAIGAPRPLADPADLELALLLADAADVISLARFRATDLQVQAKPDFSPVSDADLAVERRIRELVAEHRPGDSVVGEEFGADQASERRWVVDPIDGTKNYVRGVPIWATLIALFVADTPVLGVVSAPALAHRWWGSAGAGAYSRFNNGPASVCRVSGVNRLADASLAYSEPAEWRAAGRIHQFDALLGQAWRTRGYGDFYQYVLVAEGAVDAAGEPELNLWDLAALVPIVTEAGGTVTDIDGGPVTERTTSLLASNGLLHEQLVTALAP